MGQVDPHHLQAVTVDRHQAAGPRVTQDHQAVQEAHPAGHQAVQGVHQAGHQAVQVVQVRCHLSLWIWLKIFWFQ